MLPAGAEYFTRLTLPEKRTREVEEWGKVGGHWRGTLYGEDESGPCAGDERTGQGAQSRPFIQRGKQRIMGSKGRVWSRPLGAHHQAKASKCHSHFLNVSASVSVYTLVFVWRLESPPPHPRCFSPLNCCCLPQVTLGSQMFTSPTCNLKRSS